MLAQFLQTSIKQRVTKFILIPLLLYIFCLLQAGCLFYSFSGSSLNKKVKTFSIKDFQSKVALGPTTLADQITQSLRDVISQKTSLKEKATDGDIEFDGIITAFKHSPLAPSTKDDQTSGSRVQLSITVQINYNNKYDNNFCFKKKDFTQTHDVKAGTEIVEASNMVEEIIKKLMQDIYNASIANW